MPVAQPHSSAHFGEVTRGPGFHSDAESKYAATTMETHTLGAEVVRGLGDPSS
jgi:hypothetical protein